MTISHNTGNNPTPHVPKPPQQGGRPADPGKPPTSKR